MKIKDRIKKILRKVGLTNPHPYTQAIKEDLAACRRAVVQLRYAMFAINYHKLQIPSAYFNRCLLLHCCTAGKGWGINLGDYIQAHSVKNAVSGILPDVEFVHHERDYLADYDGKKAFVVMQGWFATDADFMPNSLLCPIYVGMHITENIRETFLDFVRMNPSYFQGHDIGCRDMDTAVFLQGLGLSAYLSRCLTLTFPKRSVVPKNGKVFIVNMPEELLHHIPEELRRNAVAVNQRQRRDYGNSVPELVPYFSRFMDDAEELLTRYKNEASLVITTAIHCASPCVGMGIPTILIDAGDEQGKRLGFLNGIITIYSLTDLATGKVNWKGEAPDLTKLQENILLNLKLTMQQERGDAIDLEQLAKVRKFIADFHC